MRGRPIKVAVLVVLGLLLFSGSLSLRNMASASASTPLVLGFVGTPAVTWMQSYDSSGGLFGTTDTQIPYLWLYPTGIDGNEHTIGVAKLPTPVPNTNDTQWVISLRSADMKWSDNVPINSTDLAYSLGIFLPTGPYANLSTTDLWGAIRGTVQNITVVNSTSIKATTAKPDPLFPVLTNLYAVYPWHYYKQFTGVNVLQNTTITGGPCDSAYCPVNYSPTSDVINLMANPLSPSWNGTTPTIQSLTVDIFSTDAAQTNAIAAGTVNGALVEASDVAALKGVPSLTVTQVPSVLQMMVELRTTGFPWNNTHFRQAMLTLIPQAQIDRQLYNDSVALGNPLWMLPQGISTYWPGPNTPTYNYSTSAAQSLLTKAGLSQSNGKWALPNGTALSVTIEVDNSDPNEVRSAQSIASAMQSIGMSATVDAVPTTTISVDFSSHTPKYQMIIWNNEVSADPFRWMRNTNNYAGWVNSTFAGLLGTAETDTNYTNALQQLKTAELYFAQSAIVTSIVDVPSYAAVNTGSFAGWQPALSKAADSDALGLSLFGETLLTAVTPAGASSTHSSQTQTISTSQAQTTQSSQTQSTSSQTQTTSTSQAQQSSSSSSSLSSSSASSSSTTTSGSSLAIASSYWVVLASMAIAVSAAYLLARKRAPNRVTMTS